MNKWGSYVWQPDSGQVGSLASQSIWPQFKHEGLLESGMTKAYFFCITHTHARTWTHSYAYTKLQRHSLWGLTERAASNLLKLNDKKAATQLCENTLVIWGIKLSITCSFMACVTSTVHVFILELRPVLSREGTGRMIKWGCMHSGMKNVSYKDIPQSQEDQRGSTSKSVFWEMSFLSLSFFSESHHTEGWKQVFRLSCVCTFLNSCF